MVRSLKTWLVVIAVAIAYFAWQRGCSARLADIEFDEGAVVVRNQTENDWRGALIWVNDYYGGRAELIRAGSFVREPITRFVDAYQRPFPIARTPVTSIVVLATTPAGEKVRVVYGKPGLR